MRPLKAIVTSVVTALLATSVLVPQASAASDARCVETDLPARLDLLVRVSVHGKLCLPATGRPTRSVQLLVHGGTYNSQYWDLPYDNGGYSYQRDMARRGHATFAIDLLGSGKSSQPPSALVTGTSQAMVVHEVVGQLRDGQVLGTRFDQIVLVGHSMGSGITTEEAAVYHDVDGVILTGMSHSMNLVALTGIFVQGVRPSLTDPVLSRRHSDPGYVTTMPGTRQMFSQPGQIDPGVLAADEATKDQVPATVVADLLPVAFNSPLTRLITVPVLMADGDRDSLFCAFHCASTADLVRSEAPFFSAAARLEVYLLPRAGHSLALAVDAADYRAAVADWLNRHFAH